MLALEDEAAMIGNHGVYNLTVDTWQVKVKVHVIQARLGIDVHRQNQNKCNDKYMY